MKKGFTLIELLAVIVILAIISLIAIPIVLDIIDDSRSRAALRSAEGYVRAVNYKIAQEALKDIIVEDGEYVIGENELAVEGNNFNGITGSYTISENRVLFAGLCVNKLSVEYNSVTGITNPSTINNYCTEEILPEFVEPEGEYVSAICTDSTKYSSTTNFKVKTVEDLVCLSNLVNSGSNFSDKTVYLVSDIDFNSNDSYSNINTTAYGDINGDNSTEGLKTEVTTGKGFKPIGTFAGVFDGYAFTISNLMINRPSESNVGLFGINMGTINGVRLRDINVTGGSITGGLVGYNKRVIKNIDIRGSVSSNLNIIGGIVGKTEYETAKPSKNDNLIFSGSVTGSDSVGGLVGWSSASTLNGIVYDSTITATAPTANVTYIGKILGNRSNYSNGAYKTSNVNLVYNSAKAQSTSARDGSNYSKLRLHNVDDAVDTYIGGDNDAATPDGYYIDYDSEYKLVLYSVVRNPIQISKLKGSGTEESPYLINSIKDWKMATSTIGSTAKYYAVTNNLDFGNDYYYSFGTSTNTFNGIFDGGFKTLSNIRIENDNYASIFSHNTGTIGNIKLNNTTIIGKNNTGSIVGKNEGTINGIIGRSVTITGEENTGGVIGYNPRVLMNADIRGTITGTVNVGGIVGKGEYIGSGVSSKTDDLVFSGNVTATDRVGGLIGWSAASTLNGVIYDSTITATAPTANVTYIGKIIGYRSNFSNGAYATSNVTLTYDSSIPQATLARDGIDYTTLRLHNVDDALDTYIGGVEGTDNYYFDYDSNNKIVLYNSIETPITNTLSGTGTSEDPYIISSLSDWRIATSTLDNTAKYYSITGNIDFNNDYMYAFGTEKHKFNGNINGNLNTLSNITIVGGNNTGIFGYNRGTISGIKVNTASITGADNTGLIVGTNEGTINGIVGRNITVTGTANVGGVIGYNPRALTNADIQGTITSSGNNVGGISGKSQYITGNPSKDENVVFKGSVTGPNNVGGLVGWSESGSVTGVTYNSTITGTSGSAVGSIIGYKSRFSSGNKKESNVTLSYTGTQSSSAASGTQFTGITIENVADTIDTTDNTNPDGYYFTLVNGEYALVHSN